jgi:hypothetical protein
VAKNKRGAIWQKPSVLPTVEGAVWDVERVYKMISLIRLESDFWLGGSKWHSKI